MFTFFIAPVQNCTAERNAEERWRRSMNNQWLTALISKHCPQWPAKSRMPALQAGVLCPLSYHSLFREAGLFAVCGATDPLFLWGESCAAFKQSQKIKSALWYQNILEGRPEKWANFICSADTVIGVAFKRSHWMIKKGSLHSLPNPPIRLPWVHIRSRWDSFHLITLTSLVSMTYLKQ